MSADTVLLIAGGAVCGHILFTMITATRSNGQKPGWFWRLKLKIKTWRERSKSISMDKDIEWYEGKCLVPVRLYPKYGIGDYIQVNDEMTVHGNVPIELIGRLVMITKRADVHVSVKIPFPYDQGRILSLCYTRHIEKVIFPGKVKRTRSWWQRKPKEIKPPTMNDLFDPLRKK